MSETLVVQEQDIEDFDCKISSVSCREGSEMPDSKAAGRSHRHLGLGDHLSRIQESREVLT